MVILLRRGPTLWTHDHTCPLNNVEKTQSNGTCRIIGNLMDIMMPGGITGAGDAVSSLDRSCKNVLVHISKHPLSIQYVPIHIIADVLLFTFLSTL